MVVMVMELKERCCENRKVRSLEDEQPQGGEGGEGGSETCGSVMGWYKGHGAVSAVQCRGPLKQTAHPQI